ncbi:YlcI/YnfO family protein [Scytonema sp. UIC 10036]|uniref:YlcI/YnfO family protein n=1 Tax=Scytonema sp. UIC 10036 TaxID=2304196 RepID=UPI00325A8AB7
MHHGGAHQYLVLLYGVIEWYNKIDSRITVRFPAELLDNAKTVKNDAESLNDLVVLALEREVRRRKGLAAHEKILAISKQIPQQPDATELIHQLREGEERDV